jgi:5-methyltetrahydropteroyltriglutamate--homocysteine methyltransferase
MAGAASLPVLPTTLVGSYPQPVWLVDKKKLLGSAPPRVRLKEVWRVSEPDLEEAQDDATRLAIHDQEAAGIDVVTDGEIRRESYFNRFATALSGIDIDRPGEVLSRTGRKVHVPRVVGPIKRERPVVLRDAQFLRAETKRPIRMTVPGAFTLAKLAQDEYYRDFGKLVDAYAAAVNAEVRDLKAAGVDVVQLDEPYLQANPDDAAKHGVRAIDLALDGIAGPSAVHLCFGYAYVVPGKPGGYSYLPELNACRADQISIEAAQPKLDPATLRQLPAKTVIYGVIDLGNPAIETPEVVAGRIRSALAHAPASRLVIAPDCGMKYLSRNVAFGKLKAMVDGAAIVRAELAARR